MTRVCRDIRHFSQELQSHFAVFFFVVVEMLSPAPSACPPPPTIARDAVGSSSAGISLGCRQIGSRQRRLQSSCTL